MSGSDTVARDSHLTEFFANLDRCVDKSTVTHGLHPYPAKFIPHIPRELISAYSEPGEVVWDPMCGSGTTLVEAAVAGRDVIGTDINPIAILASRAKTTALSSRARDELRGLLLRIRVDTRIWPGGRPDQKPILPEFHNRDHWFETPVSRELGILTDEIDRIKSDAARQLARCAFSAILVAVSNQEGETRWRARPQVLDPVNVRLRFATKLRASLSAVEEFSQVAHGKVEVERCDARVVGLPRRSVDLVVTSPPYANTHDYYLYNKLRMFWLGEPVKPVQMAEIGSRHRHSDRGEGIETYLEAIHHALGQMRRALRPGGRIAMVVADGVIRGTLHPMDQLIPALCEPCGLKFEHSYRFSHRQFNSALHNTFEPARAQKATHVLVMVKE